MPKPSSLIILSSLCALTFCACSSQQPENTEASAPSEEEALDEDTVATTGAVPASQLAAGKSDAEKAAMLAEHLPPDVFDPNVSLADKIQQSIDTQLKKIQDGGKSETLEPHAELVAKQWRKFADSAETQFSVDSPECFKGGCSFVTRHESDAELDVILNDMAHTDGFHRWNSGKFRSGPQELEQGGIKITWIFFAPPEGNPVMAPQEDAEENL